MKKCAYALTGAVLLCTLPACTTWTEATGPNGGSIKHIAVAPGVSITTKAGGCINSAGGACALPPAGEAAQ